MSELYELHLARLQRDGFLDDNRWGSEVKSGKRTGDGGQPPPANGGANTAGGKGRSGSSRGGKNSKKKPVPPWVTDTAQPGRTAKGVPKGSSTDRRFGKGRSVSKGKKDAWGDEASMPAHESYRHRWPGSRDNGISSRLRTAGPTDHHTDVRRGRGSGVSDAHGSDSRVNAQARAEYAGGIPKPGTGGSAGDPYGRGRSGNGYDSGRGGSGGSTPRPGNLSGKKKRRGGSGGRSAGNPFEGGTSPAQPGGTPKPGNIRKSIYDYSPEQVEESIHVVTKALSGILADYED